MKLSRLVMSSAALALVAGMQAQADTIAIIDGHVHTLGEAGELEGATVLIRDGEIVEVGEDVSVPEGARVIDADGYPVTPGLVDAYGSIGLVEVGAVGHTRDAAFDGREYTAAFDVTDAINPASQLIPVNRIEGITRAAVAPVHGGEGNLLAGQGAVIDLSGGADSITRTPAGMYGSLGTGGAAQAGGSRAGALLQLREAFQDAQDYAANRDAWEQGSRRDYALGRLDLDALGPVLAGEMPLVLEVNRASDIRVALRLADEWDLDLVILGGAEAWKEAERLAAADVPVLLDPTQNLPGSFDHLGATRKNAPRLYEAGVDFAFATGESHNARNITQAAGNAVAYGLPWEAAFEALTSRPAEIWGIADRVGRLEPGMEADVVIWDGDPLEVTSFPIQVLIHGEEIPMESRHTRLRDRYSDLEDQLLPRAYRK